MRTLILARHAHASSNADGIVNGIPPGDGLSPTGREEAAAFGRLLASEQIELGVSSRFLRARETLALAFADRAAPRVVEPLLDEIGFGSFEGGSVVAYRSWAWEHEADVPCPGGGESRAAAAARFAAALEALLARSEETVLAVSHALPIRYVLDAADGEFPAVQVVQVPHATPFRLGHGAVERAAATLRAWAESPRFADAPFGG